MLSERIYVRCPADIDSETDPRTFVCGQVMKIDEFKRTVTVQIHDPFNFLLFFEDLPHGTLELPISSVDHCSMFIGSDIVVRGEICKVLSVQTLKDATFAYYVQTISDKEVFCVSEKDIIASFTNGKIDPTIQLRRYEFQNPCWFMGHAVVSRSMNILDNSIYGFKELAGSKIYLLPHQVNTIMRCMQETPCRYMLADEVGMGKTIEAISVIKIYMQNRANLKILIIVPDTLKEQWKTELLLKFGISIGVDKDNNSVAVRSVGEIASQDVNTGWDFVVIDEVHRYLSNPNQYESIHVISRRTKNILLLSATPVQQRKEEYLDLLRLLQPVKYDALDIERFGTLVNKQGRIIQKTALILDDLDDFEEEIDNTMKLKKEPHKSEDCRELFEEIYDDLADICGELKDEKLSALLEKISFDSDDLGVYQTKVVISYVCGNYQIESNIIRNRRKILENNDDGTRLMPTRDVKECTYALDKDKNAQEAVCYEIISEWLSNNNEVSIENMALPLLGAFFSSSWAFLTCLEELKKKGIEIAQGLFETAEVWVKTENHIIDHVTDVLNDPVTYEDDYCTRIVTVLDILYDDLYEKKTVLFTNYTETFLAYKTALEKLFPAEEISFFGSSLSSEEMELNTYRFQNESTCWVMLCDYTGGEGRNFQCADFIIHIDLPWDASVIEQRIGRLDRLERDPARSVVTSVVVHTKDSFEEALYKFMNDGLKIFTQSLSGMEIIMKDINAEIVNAVKEDFRYGLFERIPKIVELADVMRESVRKEQNYDAAGLMFRPMYSELRRLIEYYAQNENELFASTMTNWASLAGFRGFSSKSGTVTYTAASFSPKSAINSQLIPPYWNDYLNTNQNKFVNKVQAAYDKSKSIKGQERSIKGTFIRKLAIENDYLHFFAPGDDIFDCIVNNAVNSCKGRSSAFAVLSSYEWKGLIFTWSAAPNEAYLLDHGVSVYALGPYRNYLMPEQVTIAISIDNPEGVSDDAIVREYSQIINAGFNHGKTIHLGKRSRDVGYLKDEIPVGTNITWFKSAYPEERWSEFVKSARKEACEKAREQFQRRTNIRGAREEMERTLSARAANMAYYDIEDEGIEELEKEQVILLDAMRKLKISLDSVAFVWMVRDKNGQK